MSHCAPHIVSAVRDNLWTGGWATQKQISDRTGIPCREVRRAIRELNKAGEPVVSSREGFKLATIHEELYAYETNLRQRAQRILVRAEAVGVRGDFMRARAEIGA